MADSKLKGPRQPPRTARHRIIFYHVILFIGQVYNLSLQPESATAQSKLMREAHRMLPIPLNLILRKVLRQIVAFSHSHHRVAHIHPRRFHNGRRISAMERGIRQLVFIVLGIGIGQVNGLLPRISARHNQFYFFCQGYSGGQSGIHTCGMYLAVVCIFHA